MSLRQETIIDNRKENTLLASLQRLLPYVRQMDIATGTFELGSLLTLEGEWQKMQSMRIVMGDETTRRTRDELVESLRRTADQSLEDEKENDDALRGLPAIRDALAKKTIDVRAYLSRWKAELTPKVSGMEAIGRKPGSYEWYEIQDNVAYYEEFEKPKIVYPVMVQYSRFAYEPTPLFTNDKSFLLSIDEPWLLAILNSSLVWEFLRAICSPLQGDTYEMRGIHVSKIPVPNAGAGERLALSTLVQKCGEANGQACERSEHEIEERVAALYGL